MAFDEHILRPANQLVNEHSRRKICMLAVICLLCAFVSIVSASALDIAKFSCALSVGPFETVKKLPRQMNVLEVRRVPTFGPLDFYFLLTAPCV